MTDGVLAVSCCCESRRYPSQERGRQFDRLVEDVLRAHGCTVERGRFRPGEQVDVFVHKPFRALVLCRWEAEPTGVPAIVDLIHKLTRDRPSIVFGIYVSMSGFTDTARQEAVRHARERVVILIDRNEFEALVKADIYVNDLVENKLDEIVRRY